MAIDFRKYINIISGVGGGAAVAARQLVLRIFSSSVYLDPLSVYEFTSADDVGTFFGTSSPEYKRAVFYFGWISPLIGAAQMLSFARIVTTAGGAAIFGGGDTKVLATLAAVANGNIMFVVDGVNTEITGISLTGSGSLAAVAAALQAKLIASGGTPFANCTVTFDATRNSFIVQLASGTQVTALSVIPDTNTGTDLGTLLEWTQGTGGNAVSRAVVGTPVDTFNASVNLSNNFGSFVMPTVTSLTDILAVGQQNQTQNVAFQYHVPVSAQNAQAWSQALIGVEGLGLTLQGVAGEYHEMCGPIILAATDYTKRNAVMNPMYRQFSLTPTVTDTATSNTYDALRINYYGQTQNAGQQISFYQRGKLMGGATAPVDINIYGNEQWLKSDIAANIMSGQLSLGQISADVQGEGVIDTYLQATVDAALRNGAISVGKPFTTTQKLYIGQQTGDDLAWHQVQNIGYWKQEVAQSYVATDGSTEWEINYTLIYSKNDAVRKVNGTHVLI